jgi:hypothetical protein
VGISRSNVQPVFAATVEAAQNTRGVPAARLLANEFASEHWNLTARFDSGHLLFVEFLITNIGWGDHNAAVSGHVITPDGRAHHFHNGRREGNWQLSPDRLRLVCGKNTLDLHAPQYRLDISKKNVRLQLAFRPDNSPVWSEPLTHSGYALDLLATAVPVDGSLWVEGMPEPLTVHGALAATHSWTKELASTLIVRRLEFFSLREEYPIYGIDLTAPDGTRKQWLVLKRQGAAQTQDDFTLSFDDTRTLTNDSGYLVPSALHFQGASARGDIQLDRLVLSNDPFEHLPRPLRFLASVTLNLKPRRLWALSPFHIRAEVTPDTPPSPAPVSFVSPSYDGVGVTALTYLNPLPPTRETATPRTTPLRQVQRDQLNNQLP